ncbi:MAG: FAD-dependent oxidoreductase [Desulfovibrionaceae bacterium]
MAKYDYDLCVIGGGAAGLTVASGAAQLGARTLLVEREPQLGGDCLHHGCVPSKTLIKTAKVRRLMQRAEEFGLPGVELGPVDFQKVRARIASVVQGIQEHDSVERFCSLGAQVEFGPARFLDAHILEVGDRRFSAARFVVATGSSPVLPPFPGMENVSALTNLDIFSLEKLPSSLLVLGAGPIACELGQAFARLGSSVTLLQRSGQILSREDADMAGIVEKALRAEGVDIRLGCAVGGVRTLPGGVAVEYDSGHGPQTAQAEQLLVALGRSPNVAGLDLENAGVEYDSKGITVDERMRTSQKHIYAAGDVTGKHQFTHAAGYEGGIVVTNAILRLPRKVDYTWLPWCTYTEPELAGIGRTEKECRAAGLKCSVLVEPFADNDRARAEGEIEGCIKLLLSDKGRPLGVQIAGPHAGDLAGEWIAALYGKIKLSSLAGAVHPYPTFAEINKRVAGKVFAEKIFSNRVRKILHFLFDYRGNACNVPK